jgi:hypothetical protein
MTKKSISTLVLSTMLAAALVSCKDSAIQELHVSAEAPTLINGRLNFTSLESFHAYMQANEQKTVEQLLEANRTLGFVSHLRLDSEPGATAAKSIYPSTLHCLRDGQVNNRANSRNTAKTAAKTASPGDEPTLDVEYPYIDTSIPDPLFDSVLDENREFTINNLVYRAGNDYCFYYPLGQEALVEDFYQRVDSGEIVLTDADLHAFGDLVVQRVYLVTNNTKEDMATASALPFVNNRSVDRNENWDGEHRIECQIWQGNWGVWSSSGIKTHATRYARKWVFFWGWVDFKTDRVAASATVGYMAPSANGGSSPQTATALTIAETNAAVAVKRFDWATAQVGWTNAPGGLSQQVKSIILSNMTVTIEITSAKASTLLLNYDPSGTAACDNIASVTVNGRTRTIYLR